jgi:hypothetical protein
LTDTTIATDGSVTLSLHHPSTPSASTTSPPPQRALRRTRRSSPCR